LVGGVMTTTIASMIIGPWFKSQNLDTFCVANLANFHVAAILAISTYIKPNI
jgi:hypothetical protein